MRASLFFLGIVPNLIPKGLITNSSSFISFIWGTQNPKVLLPLYITAFESLGDIFPKRLNDGSELSLS